MAAKKADKSKSAKSNAQAAIGVIGGSGLYAMNGLTNAREIRVKTPFGKPANHSGDPELVEPARSARLHQASS